MAFLFESETCSRCGGSGHYSYCQRWGTICFKCGGRKEVLTKRGAAAQRLYTRLLSKPLSSIQPGDVIREVGLTVGGDPFHAWYQVESIRKDELNPGYIVEYVRVKKGGGFAERVQFGGLTLDHIFRVRVIDPQRVLGVQMIALAYQSILSKTGKEPAWLSTVAWG